MSRRRLAALLVLAFAACAPAGCGSPPDLKQALQVTDVSNGWFDAGIVEAKNKLVPSVTFKLKKNADVNLPSVSLNVSFVFVGDQDPNRWLCRVCRRQEICFERRRRGRRWQCGISGFGSD